jgi:5'-methylthioadenosine phosphorylase
VDTAAAEIGVFGGSGFYEFLTDVEHVELDTPWGVPSAPVAIGTVGDRRVAFLPRHGTKHQLPPHRVPFRAHLWEMRQLGVQRIVGPCAAGSLQPHVQPGHFVALDQLVDRTWGRADTFYDGPDVGHVSFADPYCPELRSVLLGAAPDGIRIHPQGTVVVIQGPRFSTRAESNWYRSAGWEVINMTQYPEAFLARELGICYAGLALITDYDTGLEGVDGIEPVTMDVVFKVLADNVARTRDLLFSAIPAIAAERSCRCIEGLRQGPLGGTA